MVLFQLLQGGYIYYNLFISMLDLGMKAAGWTLLFMASDSNMFTLIITRE